MVDNRKQRLRTLENNIRQNYETWVSTGMALKEIRDDKLFKEAGFDSWEQYLRQRVGLEFGIEKAQVHRLMLSATIRPKISSHRGDEWTSAATLEFARLAPKDETVHGHPRDVDSLKKSDVTRVAKKAVERAKEQGKSVTASIVRSVVDEELGINRAAEAKQTRDNRQTVDLAEYIRRQTGVVDGIREFLEEAPSDYWTVLEIEHEGLVERFAKTCDELAQFLRS